MQTVPFEINLKKEKWLVTSIYRPPSQNSEYFLNKYIFPQYFLNKYIQYIQNIYIFRQKTLKRTLEKISVIVETYLMILITFLHQS